MAHHNTFIYFTLLAIASFVAHATDPTQLQDFCIGVNDPNNALFVNGMFCKNPMEATPEDFLFNGLDILRNTNNRLGIDFGPHRLNPPHMHPRASEVLTVLDGTLYVGFVTSNLPNGGTKLFAKVLNKGDVFVFPQGLVHFQLNVGNTPALAIVGLSSQNPGVVTVGNAVFGAQPPISVDVLSKAFQLDDKLIKYLQSEFGMSQ
ncbi:hypothetical protein RND81_14G200700 [Saponaria officinalis]|uniref:Germin-like protein n=1 Tax=Saponaria officinalis TaxID=3572 RepID=A0AAW1GPF4_SAPOF